MRVRGIRAGAAALAVLGIAAASLSAPGTALAKEARAAPARLKLDHRRIERAVSAMVADGRVVGASVLVWQGGKERLFHAAGYADREAGRPFARDTLLQIFSMTKPVTGVALMQLWEAGKFRLDDTLARYLPEFGGVQVYAGADAAGKPLLRAPIRPILVRDVLRHTAGFVYGDAPGVHGELVKAQDALSLDNTLAEFGTRMARIPLLSDPGEQWSYSAAVDMQALLVEKLSGQKFSDYVWQHVFSPLGMTQTGWAQPAAARARLARIYEWKDGAPTRWPDERLFAESFSGKPMTMGGSGLVSSVDEYLRFARMLLGQGSLDGVRVIKPSTLALMASDQLDPAITARAWLPGKGSLGFGFDFAVRDRQPATADEPRGAVGEFFWDGAPSMLFWIDPANDMVVIFATQKLPFDGTLHRDIRAAVYGPDYRGPAGD